jgi:hypothetical protein
MKLKSLSQGRERLHRDDKVNLKTFQFYCPIHHSTKHIFVDCLLYNKQKQKEEQTRKPEGPVRQEPPRHRADPHNNDDPIALGENEIAIICGSTAAPTSKTKLK